MKTSERVGRLPKAFIGVALCNFLIGATLGGVMSCWPQLVKPLVLIHAEINPYGWLTLLIYGMTYAVLTLFAGLRLPHEWQGWIHLVIAEMGMIVTGIGLVVHDLLVLQTGMIAQSLAPLGFLLNVLSAVFIKRRGRSVFSLEAMNRAGLSDHSTLQSMLLGGRNRYQDTDRVARRGTDVSLLIFVVLSMWGAAGSLLHGGTILNEIEPSSRTLLVYDGWIAGTVLSVALHLHPRFFGIFPMCPRVAKLGQASWGLAVLSQFGYITLHVPFLTVSARELFGLTFVGYATGFLLHSDRRRILPDVIIKIPPQSHFAWQVAWLCALVLGLAMLVGLSPLSLAALHLLFLGWITTLAFAVGYALFPIFFGYQATYKRSAMWQIVCTVCGSIWIMVSFYMTDHHIGTPMVLHLTLSMGGTVAFAGIVWFILIQIRLARGFRSLHTKTASGKQVD